MGNPPQSGEASVRREALLPLRYRLPNPPPVFVGRGPLLEWMRCAIERAPVTVIWGLGGMGKTALALRVLHQHFAHAQARTLFIGLSASDPKGHTRVEVVRALSEARAQHDIDWASLLASPDALTTAALDLAEQGELLVVLDDVHHDAEAIELLRPIARYARTSRWIVTSRVDPKLGELAEQTLAIPAMSAEELEVLAASCAPAADEARTRAAVQEAAGSPWRMRQLLAGNEVRSLHADIFQGTSPQAAAFLEALLILQSPLRLETVALVAPPPPPAELAALRDRGVIERTAIGWRLHDVARPLVRAAIAPAIGDRARSAAQSLAGSPEPLAALESLRLHAEAEDVEAAAALLGARGDALLVDGYTQEVWQLIARFRDPRLAHWQLRCAGDLGDTAAALAVPSVAPEPAIDLLMRARVLYRAGRIAEALATAGDAAARARDAEEARTAFEATLMQANCLAWLGRSNDSLAMLEALAPPDDDAAMLRAAHVANALAETGRYAEAVRRVADITPALRASVRSGSTPSARETARYAARALDIAGHQRRALELIDVADDGSPAALRPYAARADLLRRVACLTGIGRIAEARAALERLARLGGRTPALKLNELACEMYMRLAEGDLRGLEQRIAEFVAESEARAYRDGVGWGAYFRLRLATLRAEDLAPSELEPSWAGQLDRLVNLRAALYRARRGAVDPSVAPSEDDNGEAQILAIFVAAHAPLFAGNAEGAISLAKRAAELADELGWGAARADALQLWCDAALIRGRRSEVADVAGELARAAEIMPSPRFRADARLAHALASESAPDPSLLEELAPLRDVAPLAARRASLLLGNEDARGDRIDELVVDAAFRAWGVCFSRIGGASAETVGWGIDDATMSVWLPGGRRVSLRARKRDWRILSILAEHGGRATKEELVLGVWHAKSYHPLRDDKRLHIAIRRLRLLIEDDAAKPARIVTLEDGYAFGERETVRRSRPM